MYFLLTVYDADDLKSIYVISFLSHKLLLSDSYDKCRTIHEEPRYPFLDRLHSCASKTINMFKCISKHQSNYILKCLLLYMNMLHFIVW